MSDNHATQILTVIERLRVDLLQRLSRLEALLEPEPSSNDDTTFVPAEIIAHIKDVGESREIWAIGLASVGAAGGLKASASRLNITISAQKS